jgi:hypothetical protein
MHAGKWVTLEEALTWPKGAVVVARVLNPERVPKYAFSEDRGGFDPEVLAELKEFLKDYPDTEVHFLMIDEAPNETR